MANWKTTLGQAEKGAKQRLVQLANETAHILETFPRLGSNVEAPSRKRTKKGSTMSAAARKRISIAQKARWAKKKKAATK